MMKYILLAAALFQAAYSKCPNSCSGHGTCNPHDQCTCFNENGQGVLFLVSDEDDGAYCHGVADEATCATFVPEETIDDVVTPMDHYVCQWDADNNDCRHLVKNELLTGTQFSEWQGADCSRRTCPRSTSWTTVGEEDGGFICTHQVETECADQGVCDRATGLCECFPGFTGSACQRTACPDDCSGHGTCRSNKDFAYDFAVAKTNQMLQTHESTERFKENYATTYNSAWDSDHLYGCLCDRGYRGSNCALVECPSSDDPLDDKCSDEEDYITVENFQVQKFAGTGSAGWEQAYALSEAIEGDDDLCAAVVDLSTSDECDNVPAQPNAAHCVYVEAQTDPDVPARCEQSGVWVEYRPGDKNNHFYNGKVYACFGAMSGMDCSGRGICDYTTGQCACFSGYSGTACNQIEELV